MRHDCVSQRSVIDKAILAFEQDSAATWILLALGATLVVGADSTGTETHDPSAHTAPKLRPCAFAWLCSPSSRSDGFLGMAAFSWMCICKSCRCSKHHASRNDPSGLHSWQVAKRAPSAVDYEQIPSLQAFPDMLEAPDLFIEH